MSSDDDQYASLRAIPQLRDPRFFAFTRTTHRTVYPFLDASLASSPLHGSAAGKTVLITGGGRGLGRATAHQFALAGAKTVIVTGRTAGTLAATKAEIEAAHPATRVRAHVLDIARPADVARFFATTLPDELQEEEEEEGGGVDVLVNNAGVGEPVRLLADADAAGCAATFATNVLGSFVVSTHYVAMQRARRRGGTVLLTSSTLSSAAVAGVSAYQMSKTALNRLAESIVQEHARDGFRAVAFHPGSVATDIARELTQVLGAGPDFGDAPELGAALAVYLATDRARFLDGRFVSANWDVEELEARSEEIVNGELLRTRVVVGSA